MIAPDYGIERAASEFWDLAGAEPEYPCDLEAAITWALPLDIRAVHDLRVSHVNSVTHRSGLPYHFDGPDRRLSGCLLAYADRGIVFLDADDREDERRFTLAHELAHFLLDYRAPREKALAALGEAIRPVLDGHRPATVEERLHAVLEGVPIGVRGHLMERPSRGLPSSAVLSIETRADRLALELLAPASLALEKLEAMRNLTHRERAAFVVTYLVKEHGLPAGIARSYAAGLLHSQGGPSFREWLLGIE